MKIQRIRIHLTCFLVLCVLFGQQGIINTEAKIIQPQLSSEYKQLLSYEVDKEINYPCEYLDTDGDGIVNTKISSITRNSYSGVYGYSCLQNDEQRYVYSELEVAAEKFHYSSDDVIVKATAVPTTAPTTVQKQGKSNSQKRKNAISVLSEQKQDMKKKNIIDCPTTTSIPYSSISEKNKRNYNYYAVDVEFEENVKANNATIATVSFLYDHPEYFWSKGYTYSWIKEGDIVTRVYLHCQEEYYDGQLRAAMWEKIENGINGYLRLVSGVKNVCEKERIIHDALAENMTYAYKEGTNEPEDERWAHTIESVFSGERPGTVCEGYAKAFQLLLNAIGIECNYVVGNGANVGHAWNQVKLDGDWYNVDLTWNDTRNNSSHRYFNVTDECFGNHVAYTNSAMVSVGSWCYPVQPCVATKYAFSNLPNSENVAYYKVIIPQVDWGKIQIYNQGVEVESGSLVEEETTLDVVIVPTVLNVFSDILVEWEDEKFHFQNIVTSNGVEFSFVIHSDTKFELQYEIPVNLLMMKKTEYKINGYGKKMKLSAVVFPKNHTEKLQWNSSNNAVATVNNGVVTSVGAGNAVITVSNETGTVRGKCVVKVTAPKIKIVRKKTKMKVGSVFMFEAKMSGIKGDVSWRLSKRSIATIDRTSGIFTAKKSGKVRVYAYKGNIETSILVTIKK